MATPSSCLVTCESSNTNASADCARPGDASAPGGRCETEYPACSSATRVSDVAKKSDPAATNTRAAILKGFKQSGAFWNSVLASSISNSAAFRLTRFASEIAVAAAAVSKASCSAAYRIASVLAAAISGSRMNDDANDALFGFLMSARPAEEGSRRV